MEGPSPAWLTWETTVARIVVSQWRRFTGVLVPHRLQLARAFLAVEARRRRWLLAVAIVTWQLARPRREQREQHRFALTVAVMHARARVWYAAVLWAWCEASYRAEHLKRRASIAHPRRLRRAAWGAWRRAVPVWQASRAAKAAAARLRASRLTRRALAAWRIGSRVGLAARAIAEGYLQRLSHRQTMQAALWALAMHRARIVHWRAAAAAIAARREAALPPRLRRALRQWAMRAVRGIALRAAAAAVVHNRAHWQATAAWGVWKGEAKRAIAAREAETCARVDQWRWTWMTRGALGGWCAAVVISREAAAAAACRSMRRLRKVAGGTLRRWAAAVRALVAERQCQAFVLERYETRLLVRATTAWHVVATEKCAAAAAAAAMEKAAADAASERAAQLQMQAEAAARLEAAQATAEKAAAAAAKEAAQKAEAQAAEASAAEQQAARVQQQAADLAQRQRRERLSAAAEKATAALRRVKTLRGWRRVAAAAAAVRVEAHALAVAHHAAGGARRALFAWRVVTARRCGYHCAAALASRHKQQRTVRTALRVWATWAHTKAEAASALTARASAAAASLAPRRQRGVLAAWSAAAVATAVRRLVCSHVTQRAATRRLRLALGGWEAAATVAATTRAQARVASDHRRAHLLGCGWVALTSHVAASYHIRRALAHAASWHARRSRTTALASWSAYTLRRRHKHQQRQAAQDLYWRRLRVAGGEGWLRYGLWRKGVAMAEATAAAEQAERRRFALAAHCARHWKRKALRARRRLTADATSTVTVPGRLPRTWVAAAAAAAVPLHDFPSLHLPERPPTTTPSSAATAAVAWPLPVRAPPRRPAALFTTVSPLAAPTTFSTTTTAPLPAPVTLTLNPNVSCVVDTSAGAVGEPATQHSETLATSTPPDVVPLGPLPRDASYTHTTQPAASTSTTALDLSARHSPCTQPLAQPATTIDAGTATAVEPPQRSHVVHPVVTAAPLRSTAVAPTSVVETRPASPLSAHNDSRAVVADPAGAGKTANKAKRAGLVVRGAQGSPTVWGKENFHPNGFAESDSVSPTASEDVATAHHVIPFERPAQPSESEAEAMEAALAAYDTLQREEARCQQALDEWLGRLGRGGEPHDGDDCDKVLSSDDAVALAELRARLEKAGRARRDRLPAVRRMHARLSAMHASTVDIVV